ncbi:MAG: rhodanese-like domain-containing protein [Deltaproteobacteria bacterium]|nr:rhodanese-like domain-containing protein [Deltaproteobacteria bacterium]
MKGLILVAVLFFIAWDALWWLLGVKPLFPWQLKRQLSAGAPDLLLLDVRTPAEFNWFHLPKAQNAPNVLLDGAKMPAASPEQPVVVICMTGHHSPLVAYALKKRGFKQVYNLTWGMLGWQIYRLFAGPAAGQR